MEHRLCYLEAPQRSGPPEATPVIEVERTREQIHEENQQKLLSYLRITAEQKISERVQMVLNDPEALAKELRMWEIKQEDRFKETTGIFRVDLQETQAAIQGWNTKKAKQRVLSIIKELQKKIPEKSDSIHRYGTTEGLAFQIIRDDQQFIDGMQTADNPPEVTKALSHVRSALSYLSEQDISYTGWQYQQEKKQNKFDNTIKGMGKMTIIFAGLAAGLVTGSLAIFKMIRGKSEMKDFLAPLLCFGIAAPLMSASLRRTFSSLESNLKTDLNVSIRNPAFRDLCTEYHIQGPGWSNALRRMFANPEKMKNLASHYRSLAAVPEQKKLDKEINDFVRSSGLQGDDTLELHRMIVDGRLPYLSDTLGRVETEDGKGVLLDYVKIGAREYENTAYSNADELKKLDAND